MGTALGTQRGSSEDGLSAAPIGVLVIDDVDEIRQLLGFLLNQDPRFRVVGEARDGREGIRKAGSLRPDLIVLDLVMPGMDGLAALPRLHDVAPGARIVVLSSLEEADAEGHLQSLGAIGYLDKTLQPAQLVESLAAMAGALQVVEEALAEARSRLANEVESAGSARRFVETTLSEWDWHDDLEVVKLLVSELVTNAVVHADSDAEVVVQLTPSTLHVEVLDSSFEMPVLRRAAEGDTSGRGLALVETFASAWGVRPLPHGKSVWFEVPRTMASDGRR